MAFPDEILAEDEEVVVHLHPHWKTMVRPGAVFILVTGLLAYAGLSLPDATWAQAILVIVGLLAVVAMVLWVLVPFLKWRTTHYVFTSHRVLLRHGVLSRHGRDIPLSRVNDVSFSHDLIDRMLGCGTLVVESAGENGQLILREIPSVERVQSTLYQLVEEDNERRSGMPSMDEASERAM